MADPFISNPFDEGPRPGFGSGPVSASNTPSNTRQVSDQAIANPFEDQTPPAETAKPEPQVTISAKPEPSGLAERFENWAGQVAHDLRRGTDSTWAGKIMKFLGAPGLEKGVSQGTADYMGSPVLGPVRMMKGAAQMVQGAQNDSPMNPLPIPISPKGIEGMGNVVGGALDTATIPSAFVAPEASEAIDVGANAATKGAKQAVGAVKQAFSKGAVTKNMASELGASLDRVASEAGLPASKNASLSGKAGEIVTGLKQQAQKIYGDLDKASGGRYQRFVDEIDDLTDALRNKYTTPDVAAKLKEQLAGVRQAYADVQRELVSQGVDPATIKAADSKWAQAKALEQVGKKFKIGESLSGELKPGTPSVDTGLKNLKSHILPQATKGEANAIRQSVTSATEKVAKVKRNQKIAAALGAGGAGTTVLGVLAGRKSKPSSE